MKLKKSPVVSFVKRSVLLTIGLVLVVIPFTATQLTLADPGVPAFTEYPTPTANSNPTFIVTAPDGTSYFSEISAGQIGKINQSGAITEYSLPSNDSSTAPTPYGIALGNNPGEVLYTDTDNNAIGDLDTNTGAATLYPIPTAGAGPESIARDCSGGTWFTEESAAQIGKLNADGSITEFAVPGGRSNHPAIITAGPQSGTSCTPNMWFSEDNSNKIGEIDQNGTITEYTIPDGSGVYEPFGITTGPDGALWFTGLNTSGGPDIIGRLSTAGDFTLFPLPDDMSPTNITTGPDGALWFTNSGGSNESSLGHILDLRKIPQALIQPVGWTSPKLFLVFS
jgi:virginiamycin B lyase